MTTFTQESIAALRREIHSKPEPGWAEFVSSARAIEKLESLGFTVKCGREVINPDFIRGANRRQIEEGLAFAKSQGVKEEILERLDGVTGVVGILETGRPGPVMAIRFELDCVPVTETSNPDHIPNREGFASCRPGYMHACGHDGHQAVGLTLAQWFAEHKDELCGTLKLLFQPAEEGVRGARPMAESGIVDDVDFLYCGHLGCDIPGGTVVTAPEKFLCTTKLDYRFRGTPSHAGMHPQTGRNALMAAANAAINLMALPRHGDGMTRVNVGNLHAGEGRNVVAAHATMQIEVRGANEKIKDYLAHEAVQRCAGMAMAFDVQMKHRVVGEAVDFTPDDSVSQLITVCAKRARYCRNIQPHLTVTYSDDATVMFRRVQQRGGKAGYFIVGAMPTRDGKPIQTTENVDFDERYLTTLYDTYTNVIMALSGEW